MSRQTQYFPLKGGINTEVPALSIKPGELIDAFNYEPVTEGGYRRVDGYERFDGHMLASDATYYIMNFTAGEHLVNIGETVVGDASFAQGVVLGIVVTSGDWSTNDAVGYFVVWIKEGVFIDGESLSIYHPEAHDADEHDASHE